jgi:hypothetical protein
MLTPAQNATLTAAILADAELAAKPRAGIVTSIVT